MLLFYGTILWRSIIALLFVPLYRRLAAALAQGSQFIATHALSIGQDTFSFVASLFITLYLAFFLIRDGDGVVRSVRQPLLVGKDTRMPDYVVMITSFGGIAVFGINGLILGPAIAAMFIAVWHIYVATRSWSRGLPRTCPPRAARGQRLRWRADACLRSTDRPPRRRFPSDRNQKSKRSDQIY